MNRMFKVGLAALALAAVTPAFAQEVEEEEGPIGFTPVAIGLATPVQLPWGINRWDVFGLDLNVFYSDAPTMYGIDIGGLATLTRDKTMGLVVGGLGNVAFDDVYGLRATLGLEYCSKGVWGADLGLVGVRDDLHGLDVEFLGSYQRKVCGLQVSGLANVATEDYGFQLAAIFNMTEELHGAQISLVNYADYCASGFQIGLVNIIMSNQIKVLPLVNGYF